VKDVIYGQEITKGVVTRHVCFPPVDVQETSGLAPGTAATAAQYVHVHRMLESWTQDDTAAWISTSGDVKDEIGAGKMNFIASRANSIAKVDARILQPD
jgi:hypothetical protein